MFEVVVSIGLSTTVFKNEYAEKGNMNTLIRIFTAHALGDAAFQTEYLASHKAISTLACFAHAGVLASCFYLLLGIEAFWIQLISHFCIDWVSSRYWINQLPYGHALDQFCHFIFCVITYIVIKRKEANDKATRD